jgi:DNA-binding NtrC family response regulator
VEVPFPPHSPLIPAARFVSLKAWRPENHNDSPRILIVDDDPGQRSLLTSFLQGQGFETVTVDSGQRALETLRTSKFDMMISDVRMPGLSGLETLRLARKEHATLPVLLVTAFTDVRDAVAAMRDGAATTRPSPLISMTARVGSTGHRRFGIKAAQ